MANNLPPEALAAALAAVHKTGVQTPNAGSPQGSPQAGPSGAQTDPTQTADPNAPTDPNAAQGQDPNEQAVWSEFPATDPSNVEALAQQMQGAAGPEQLVQLLGQFIDQADADNQKLSQMHEAMLAHLMELLGGSGNDTAAAASQPSGASPVPAGPGVGGVGAGY